MTVEPPTTTDLNLSNLMSSVGEVELSSTGRRSASNLPIPLDEEQLEENLDRETGKLHTPKIN